MGIEVVNGQVIMDKDTRRAIDAMRRVEKGPAWARASAYVVIHPDGKQYGKIKCAHPADGMGPIHVFAWDCTGSGLQYGKASGCGYDKLSVAMCGMTWDGMTFGDHPNGHWETMLRQAGYQVIQAL